MITAYYLQGASLHMQELTTEDQLPEQVLWVDCFEPDEAERSWLSGFYQEEMPDQEDINEIEASSRFYIDKDGLHIHSLFPHKVGKELRGVNVSFNLRERMLFTVREEDIGLIRLFRNYVRQHRISVRDPLEVLVHLFNLKVDYLSDLLEDVYTVLEKASQQVFEDDELDEMLRLITIQEDANGKIRLSLLDTQRSLRFLQRYNNDDLDKPAKKEIKEMLADIESLLPHTQFLFDKINFLMDAAMSFTSLQQNKIIKIFSVAAVIFLPPTLIASIYGMNFDTMPELHTEYGYPMAIAMMLASAFGTYFFFKRKGWL
ncbi:magnesium transporter [Pokkaliibacter plantistimulans]|uniref:Magnesium transport protein CorA n=2 Tax=Pseudomonadota TaxID=1224 RepID=A0ABX5LW64_9GAMM|nr:MULTISPECIES: magnesium/cobalt transporter CorA [Pokkaliibacter]MDH2433182.1 magnesium/cobalt transporter CorA [Pokkaliibacter sp. MBI-7]PPC78035.1 magnesium and cobalt transport protein CorA [Pokkaliibacter plantistimulans]PXF29738.1 magnesium transporter [Pokkaliibacter plantistimulans]